MKMITIYLSEGQIKLLKELSKRTGLSVSEHVRRAVDIYLYMEHKERMEALKTQAQQEQT